MPWQERGHLSAFKADWQKVEKIAENQHIRPIY